MTNLLLLPLMLLAADAPEVPPPSPPLVKFEIRDVHLQGLDWRGALVGRAEQVDWVDGVTFWTIDDATLRDLLTDLQGSTRSNVVQAPRLVAREGEIASYKNMISRNIVAGLNRVADGPRFEATAIAFQPLVKTVEDGIRLDVSASRAESNAYVLDVEVCDKQIEAVYSASFEDGVKGDPKAGTQPSKIQSQYQVPRVVKVAAEANCTVPDGRHLLVCLGPRASTVKGKIRTREVLHERFLIITPRGTQEAATASSPTPQALPKLPSPVGN